jgi:hypothetical protein
MENALTIVSLAGGCAAAWFCEKQLEPWRQKAKQEGGSGYVRASWISAWSIIAAFFAGGIATRLLFLWMG